MGSARRSMKLRDYPGVSSFQDNRGTLRHRYRRKGYAVYLHGEPGSEQFESEYAAARGSAGIRPRGTQPKKGTINALCTSYYASAEFLALRDSTKRTYRASIEPFRERHGDKPFAQLERRHIKAEIAKLATTPAQANKLLKRLRQLLDHAVEMEWLKVNPAVGVKPVRTEGGFAEWPEDLIARFEAHWPFGTRQRLALDLLLYTGQRRSDVVLMARANIREGAIRVVQVKTGAPLWIPIHPHLAESIAAASQGGLYLLMTEYGRPFSSAGFGNWFREQCNAAGVERGYSAHGLRKAAGRRLADAGCTAHQVMAVLGHRSLSEATRYTKGADQRRNAEAAIARLGTLDERNLSSAPKELSSNKANSLK